MARPNVIQTGGDASHRRGLAFRNCVFGQRRINPYMHVRIHAARKRQIVLAVEDLFRLLTLDLGRKPADLTALDSDVETIDGSLVGPHHAGIFYDEIEWLRHSPFLTDFAAGRSGPC